jgi:hypothetical protein
MWDPSLSSEALLEEYYTNFFGAAAGPIRAFYEFAEAYRNTHAGPATWIKYYMNESAMLFEPEALLEMRTFLSRAEAAVAADSARLRRVQVVSEAFAFTEKYADYTYARGDLVRLALASAGAASDWDARAAQIGLDTFIETRSAFDRYAKELMQNPMHSRLSYFLRILQSDPVGALLLTAADHDTELNIGSDSGYLPYWQLAREYAADAGAWQSLAYNRTLMHGFNLSGKSDFLGPKVPNIAPWNLSYRQSEHAQFSALEARGPNNFGLRISGIDALSLFGDFSVHSGRDYLLKVGMAYRISSDNRTQIRFAWSDVAGKRFELDVPIQLPVGASDGVVEVAIPAIAPEGADSLRVEFVLSRFYGDDFLDLHRIDLLEGPEPVQ